MYIGFFFVFFGGGSGVFVLALALLVFERSRGLLFERVPERRVLSQGQFASCVLLW